MATRFVSLREDNVRRAGPSAFDWTGGTFRPVADREVARDVAGRDVVLAVHGFNVSRRAGAAELAALGERLALGAGYRYFGVLWPGDFWLPAVNYAWAGGDAEKAGRRLAAYLNRVFAGAASVAFIAHSLGARVALEAVKGLNRPAREVCLAAAAVDSDCLQGQYLAAVNNAGRIAALSSVKDKVLRLAYPAGDFLADVLFGDGDNPWKGALGLEGPAAPVRTPVLGEAIPRDAGFDHGDYLPPADPPAQPPADPKWAHAAAYMRRAVTGEPSRWS
jgi:hypothetical protein